MRYEFEIAPQNQMDITKFLTVCSGHLLKVTQLRLGKIRWQIDSFQVSLLYKLHNAQNYSQKVGKNIKTKTDGDWRSFL